MKPFSSLTMSEIYCFIREDIRCHFKWVVLAASNFLHCSNSFANSTVYRLRTAHFRMPRIFCYAKFPVFLNHCTGNVMIMIMSMNGEFYGECLFRNLFDGSTLVFGSRRQLDCHGFALTSPRISQSCFLRAYLYEAWGTGWPGLGRLICLV